MSLILSFNASRVVLCALLSCACGSCLAVDGWLPASRYVQLSQTSTASATNTAGAAVDGANGTFSQTADLPGSYWQADLGRSCLLKQIEVVNRVTPNDRELEGLTLRLLNLDDQVVFQTGLTNPGSGGTVLLNLPAGLRARLLWIGLTGSQTNGAGTRRVGLAEVRTYGDLDLPYGPAYPSLTNGVRVWQSSDYSASYPATNAVDGFTNTFTHTQNLTNSYWMADLGQAYPIDRVELVNRADAAPARMAGLTLRIFNGASNSVAATVMPNPGLGRIWTNYPTPGTQGRYLRVGLESGQTNGDGTFYVTLAEARVFSGSSNVLVVKPVSIPVTNNLASFKPCYMVRLTTTLAATTNANDNNAATEVKTTTQTVDGYWETDLGATYALYGVRTIAASGIGWRLTNAMVRLFNDAHESVYARQITGTPDIYDTDLGGPVFARYVRVGLENKRRTDPAGGLEWYIGMREVEVFGRSTNSIGITTFTASTQQVTAGQSVALNWSVEDAHRVELRPALGSLGAYTATNGAGSLNVTLSNSTEYILIASNAAGVFSRAVGIEVNGAPLPLRISEIMADNKYSLQDGYGDASDWIELRNPGNTNVNLTGYGLSDNPALPMKWVFPATNLPPHGTLIVFASGRATPVDAAGYLHADFRLDNNGGTLVLTAPNGVTTVDSLTAYPAQDTDLAYGRDLEGNWTFMEPTPGRINTGTLYTGWLQALDFSHARGFYQTPFTLFLTNHNPGATVLYSLDGTEPTLVYTNGIAINGTKAVRAQAVQAGCKPARIQTKTFIFLDDVITSAVMQTNITQNALYAPRLRPGLLSLPTVSLVLPGQPEYEEKEGSVEVLWPNGGEPVQENCSIVRFGNAWTQFAKRAFRAKFRAATGSAKLQVPLFNGYDRGVLAKTAFDEIEFRSGSQDMVSRGFYMAGPFVHDTTLDMGSLNPHSRFVHVYVNGVYWGQYDAREALVEHFLADYLGGRAEDYVNVRGNDNVGNNFVPGTPEPPNILPWDRVQTLKNSYNAVKPYLDVSHLIDFMILWNYGNCESEYRASGPLTAGTGFKFWMADADGFLRTNAMGLDRTTNAGPGGAFGSLVTEAHPDFMTLVADRIYKHCFNDGALTPARNDARLTARMQEIHDSLVVECARWAYRTPSNWEAAATEIRTNLFPYRTTELVDMLRLQGLYPYFDPPSFDQFGGLVTNGFHPQLSSADGTIYYTLNGSDPRLPGGGISPLAQIWNPGAVVINQDITLSARVYTGDSQWSALAQPRYLLASRRSPTTRDLLVTEIHYHPADSDEYEFIELYNAGTNLLDLTGIGLSNAVRFNFPAGFAMPPGTFTVVVENSVSFAQRYQNPASPWYWPGITVAGQWAGGLGNADDLVSLLGTNGIALSAVPYKTSGDWPERADGRGSSMELRSLPGPLATEQQVKTHLATGRNYTSSSLYQGSPGRFDTFVKSVRIHEVLTHTDQGVDWVELLNTGSQPVSLADCTLTDQLGLPMRYAFATNTIVQPGQFLVLSATQLGFGFGELGDDVSLLKMTGTNVSRFLDSVDFPAATREETFGLFTRSDGELDFTELRANTPGAINALPRVGPIAISEIMAWPGPGMAGFIELVNITNGPVPLFDPLRPTNVWRLEGVGSFDFPTGLVLQAGNALIVCATNPAAFRTQYGLGESVPVLGPWPGGLDPDGETLKLLRPGDPETNGVIPYYRVDHVSYRFTTPWPASNSAVSLEKIPLEAYGNDPVYWRLGSTNGTPGSIVSNRVPVVNVTGATNVNELTPCTLTVSAVDVDVPWQTVTLSTNLLPTGSSLETSSGTFSWTPSEAQGPGHYLIAFSASDNSVGGLNQATVQYPVYVNEVNLPPVWTNQPDVQFPAGLPWQIPLGVSDPDLPLQPLSFEVTGLPSGLQFETNTVRIIGAGAAPGTFPITLKVSDGQTPPQEAILNFTVRLTEPFTFKPKLTAGSLSLTFPAITGQTYRVEYCDDLAFKSWQLLQETVQTQTNVITANDAGISAKTNRFYRVKWLR